MIKSLLYKIKMYGLRKMFFYLYEYIKIRLRMLVVGSYSQLGEDLVLEKLLDNKKTGFYLDIGANDPVYFNNTYRFYKKGWHGINIEPNTAKFTKFQEKRSKDINLNIGIAVTNSILPFFRFSPDTLCTFDNKEKENYISQGFTLEGTEQITVKPLKEVLDENLNGKQIDFMTVDTEGYNLEVLKSNNWEKYKPSFICIEAKSHSSTNDDDFMALDYLKNLGYIEIFNNGLNVIFKFEKEKVESS